MFQVKSLVLLLASIFLLTSCNRVLPLHMAHKERAERISNIKVSVIEGRDGQRLRNRLIEFLQDAPIPTNKNYNVITTFSKSQEGYAVDETSSFTRVLAKYTASFSLQQDGKTVFLNSASVVGSYNVAYTGAQVVYAVFNTIDESLLDQLAWNVYEKIRLHITS